jgi:hypothetical protein
MKFVVISGHAQHGKDTVANFMKNSLEQKGKKVLIVHFADYLKFVCGKYFGWNGEKDDQGRTLLQYVGTDLIRSKNHRFWVDIVCQLSKVLEDQFDYILVPDCRFPDEVNIPKQFYGFDVTSIRVNRYENRNVFDNGLSEEQKNHPSETSLDKFDFDYYIFNHSDLKSLGEATERISKNIA